MAATFNFRQLAASTAVALAFTAANGNAAGLSDDNDAVNRYRPVLSEALAKATGDDMARIRARGFMVELEKTLKEPGEKARIVVYPRENSTNMLVVAAAVPPKGGEMLLPAAVVCAQQHGRPLAAWIITNKGEVLPRPVTSNPEGSTRAACNATLIAARDEFAQKLAQQTNPPSQGAPPAAEAKPAAVVATNPTPALR